MLSLSSPSHQRSRYGLCCECGFCSPTSRRWQQCQVLRNQCCCCSCQLQLHWLFPVSVSVSSSSSQFVSPCAVVHQACSIQVPCGLCIRSLHISAIGTLTLALGLVQHRQL